MYTMRGEMYFSEDIFQDFRLKTFLLGKEVCTIFAFCIKLLRFQTCPCAVCVFSVRCATSRNRFIVYLRL